MSAEEEKREEERKRLENDQINSLYHRLWTKSVGTIGYDKKEWQQLQKLLLKRGIVT